MTPVERNSYLKLPLWVIPVLFCVALYWRGIVVWFVQDDLMWLGLRHLVTDLHSFLWAMFAPLAQGTIRPLGERGFFMLFSALFGVDALPYRVFIFLNQAVNLILIYRLARKLSGAETAGLSAPVLWLASPALVIPMMWTSSYNEIQCTTFLLLSFYFLIRYTESGEARYFWLQVLTFCLGFASNEVNVVYPALAAAYTVIFARKYLRALVPLFLISVVFFVIDRRVAGGSAQGVYAMSFSAAALWTTLKAYLWIPVSGVSGSFGGHGHAAAGRIAAGFLLASFLAAAAWRVYRRDYVPAFGLAWFLAASAPFLLLPNHITDYYGMIPEIGMAFAAAHLIALAWAGGTPWRVFAGLLLAAYLAPSAMYVNIASRYHYERAERTRALVEGVMAAKQRHPGKTILLRNVDEPLFWSTIYDQPFARIFGWKDVLLAPEVRQAVKDDANRETLDGFFFPEGGVRSAIASGLAVAYSVDGQSLRDTTQEYLARLGGSEASIGRFVDAGSPYFNSQLGDGWFGLENGARWSGRKAVVFLAGPAAANQKLSISGWVAAPMLAKGPLHVTVHIDGVEAQPRTISPGDTSFHFEYGLPPQTVGRAKIEVDVAVDRTTRVPPDGRDLGLEFGRFQIK